MLTLNAGYVAGTGTAPIAYQWSPASYFPGVNAAQPSPTLNLTTGSSPVTIQFNVTLTDVNQCSTSGSISVTVKPGPVTEIVGDHSACSSDPVYCAEPFPTSENFQWITPSGLTTVPVGSNCIRPDWTTTNFVNGVSTLTLTVSNSYKCNAIRFHEVVQCCTVTSGQNQFQTNNYNLTTSFLPPVISGPIQLNGVLSVNSHFTFSNARVEMAGLAKILILPGGKLTIKNSEVYSNCDRMWDGIYIDGSTSGEVVIDGSSIEDAEVAIYSTDGGKFTILNSAFNKNFRNILMKTANGTHPGLVSNTSFSCSSSATSVSFPGAYLRAPHTTERTYSGIEAYTVDLFSISDNSFDNMNFGIIGDNSSLTIYRNNFSNIKQLYGSQKPKVLPLPAQWGVAIWASGNTGSPVRALTVGGSISQQNTIMNGTHGVIAEKNINTYVIGNKFQNLGGGSPSLNNSYAVLVRNQRARTIQVNSNEILRFRYGVRILQIVNSNAEIKYNTFNNLGGTVNTGLTAISAENAGVKSFTANSTSISNNTIKNCNVGVYASYYPGIHIYPNNDVSFPHASGTVSKIGIHVVGCNGAIIDGNMITKANPTVSASYKNNWLGISVENSLKTTVGMNTVTNMGTGIRVYENCDVAQLVCNTFDRCYRGFWFTGAGGGTATIGNQLGSVPNEYPSANQWLNMGSTNFRLEGAIYPGANWFYSSGASFYPLPLNLIVGSVFGPFVSSNPSFCSSLPMIPHNPGSDPREDFIPTASGTLDFNSFEEENKKLNKKYLYSKLKAEQNLLTVGNPMDQVFQAFYSTESNTNTGKFEGIAHEMSLGNHSSAAFENTLISGTYVHEENLRTVNEVYLKSWGAERYRLDSTETITLSDIADQDPLIAGHEAVYSSRTMLNRHIVDYGSSNLRIIQVENLIQEDDNRQNQFEIYPNPSTGVFLVSANEPFEFKLFDLNGRMLYSAITSKDGLIDLSTLQNGVYLFKAFDGADLEIRKIIIAK